MNKNCLPCVKMLVKSCLLSVVRTQNTAILTLANKPMRCPESGASQNTRDKPPSPAPFFEAKANTRWITAWEPNNSRTSSQSATLQKRSAHHACVAARSIATQPKRLQEASKSCDKQEGSPGPALPCRYTLSTHMPRSTDKQRELNSFNARTTRHNLAFVPGLTLHTGQQNGEFHHLSTAVRQHTSTNFTRTFQERSEPRLSSNKKQSRTRLTYAPPPKCRTLLASEPMLAPTTPVLSKSISCPINRKTGQAGCKRLSIISGAIITRKLYYLVARLVLRRRHWGQLVDGPAPVVLLPRRVGTRAREVGAAAGLGLEVAARPLAPCIVKNMGKGNGDILRGLGPRKNDGTKTHGRQPGV